LNKLEFLGHDEEPRRRAVSMTLHVARDVTEEDDRWMLDRIRKAVGSKNPDESGLAGI
jgi:hypothetical protein